MELAGAQGCREAVARAQCRLQRLSHALHGGFLRVPVQLPKPKQLPF